MKNLLNDLPVEMDSDATSAIVGGCYRRRRLFRRYILIAGAAIFLFQAPVPAQAGFGKLFVELFELLGKNAGKSVDGFGRQTDDFIRQIDDLIPRPENPSAILLREGLAEGDDLARLNQYRFETSLDDLVVHLTEVEKEHLHRLRTKIFEATADPQQPRPFEDVTLFLREVDEAQLAKEVEQAEASLVRVDDTGFEATYGRWCLHFALVHYKLPDRYDTDTLCSDLDEDHPIFERSREIRELASRVAPLFRKKRIVLSRRALESPNELFNAEVFEK